MANQPGQENTNACSPDETSSLADLVSLTCMSANDSDERSWNVKIENIVTVLLVALEVGTPTQTGSLD